MQILGILGNWYHPFQVTVFESCQSRTCHNKAMFGLFNWQNDDKVTRIRNSDQN